MTRRLCYSKPLAAAAAAALLAAGAMVWARAVIHARLSELHRNAESAERDMRSQISAMSEYESENVNSLRRKVGSLRAHLGTEGTWDGLVRRLGNGWAAEIGPREDKQAFCVQLGTVTLLSHAVSEWPHIVDVAGQLEAIPGVGIAEFEMKTSGSGSVRSLDTARLTVVVQTSRAATNSEIPQ